MLRVVAVREPDKVVRPGALGKFVDLSWSEFGGVVNDLLVNVVTIAVDGKLSPDDRRARLYQLLNTSFSSRFSQLMHGVRLVRHGQEQLERIEGLCEEFRSIDKNLLDTKIAELIGTSEAEKFQRIGETELGYNIRSIETIRDFFWTTTMELIEKGLSNEDVQLLVEALNKKLETYGYKLEYTLSSLALDPGEIIMMGHKYGLYQTKQSLPS